MILKKLYEAHKVCLPCPFSPERCWSNPTQHFRQKPLRVMGEDAQVRAAGRQRVQNEDTTKRWSYFECSIK